jgi:hypothetical protein
MAPRSAVMAAPQAPAASIVFTRFDSAAAFELGNHRGTDTRREVLTLAPGVTSGTWISPDVDPGILYTQLIAS